MTWNQVKELNQNNQPPVVPREKNMVLLEIYKNKQRRCLWVLSVTPLIWNFKPTHAIPWRPVFVERLRSHSRWVTRWLVWLEDSGTFLEPQRPTHNVYHLAQLPMYWFMMAPYKSPPFGSCAIYFHYGVCGKLESGCFNWMMQNFYMNNGGKWLNYCKHTAFNGCSTATSGKANSFIKQDRPGKLKQTHWRSSPILFNTFPWICSKRSVEKEFQNYILQGTNISHLGKRKIIFKSTFGRGYVTYFPGG